MIEPWWPLAVMAAVQAGDAAMCVAPLPFIRQCLIGVRFPQRYWWVFPPIKAAAAAGLVIGIWFRPLAILTAAALVAYFVIAVTMHIRAADIGRNLGSATGMLILSGATLAFTLAA